MSAEVGGELVTQERWRRFHFRVSRQRPRGIVGALSAPPRRCCIHEHGETRCHLRPFNIRRRTIHSSPISPPTRRRDNTRWLRKRHENFHWLVIFLFSSHWLVGVVVKLPLTIPLAFSQPGDLTVITDATIGDLSVLMSSSRFFIIFRLFVPPLPRQLSDDAGCTAEHGR